LHFGGAGVGPEVGEVLDQAHRDGEFVLSRRVVSSVAFDETLKLEPIFALATVGRVGESVHFEGLSDGT
jgi:hypothetical protein